MLVLQMQSDTLMEMVKNGGIFYILMLIGVTMHEFGHAFAADRLGDPLPRLQGRVTMNPLAHMDMLGTVILPILMIVLSYSTAGGGMILFGWGKPVQVSLPNPKTRVRDDLLSTAAGPAMNLVLALLSAVLAALATLAGFEEIAGVCAFSIFMNCMLFVINMVPLPPLDGSHFLRYAVNMREETYMQLSRWGFVIFLVLINIPAFRRVLHFLISHLAMVFFAVADFICGVFK